MYRTIFQSRRRRIVFKQGSLFAFKIILIYKYIFIFFYIFFYKIKTEQEFLCVNSIDRTFGWIDTSEYYAAPELEGSSTLFWNTLYKKSLCRLLPKILRKSIAYPWRWPFLRWSVVAGHTRFLRPPWTLRHILNKESGINVYLATPR